MRINRYSLPSLALCLLLTACAAPESGQTSSEQTSATGQTTSPVTEETAEPPAVDKGGELVIYSNYDALEMLVKTSFEDYTDNGDHTGSLGDIKIVWQSPPANADYNYSDVLRYELGRGSSDEDGIIDLYWIESDYGYFEQYAQSYAIPVSDIGITEEDTSQMYGFTKQRGTVDGKLYGIAWEASVGVFAYRRSIAKEVLGTEEPSEVQQYVADWEKFTETAQQMKNSGYFMHITDDETLRLFYQAAQEPVVGDEGVTIPDSLLEWAEQSRLYTESGFVTDASIWSDKWAERMDDGTVFGCFMPTWGIGYTVPSNAQTSGGDWAICEGPAPYYWGDEYLCVSKNTGDADMAAEFLRRLLSISRPAEGYTVMPNNISAAQALSEDDSYSSEFLGGQNPYTVYHNAATLVDAENVSGVGYGISEYFGMSMREYISGDISYDEAVANFRNEPYVRRHDDPSE